MNGTGYGNVGYKHGEVGDDTTNCNKTNSNIM
jgi:hypothetical protein